MTTNFVCMCISHCQKQMYKTLRRLAILSDKTVAKKIAKCAALTTVAVKNKCEVVVVKYKGLTSQSNLSKKQYAYPHQLLITQIIKTGLGINIRHGIGVMVIYVFSNLWPRGLVLLIWKAVVEVMVNWRHIFHQVLDVLELCPRDQTTRWIQHW